MYLLGFDGGGTKTECVLTDAAGSLLAHGSAGPSNPLRVGFDKAFAALAAAGDTVLSAARVDSRQVSGVCAGLAGASRPRVVKRVMAFLVQAFEKADVHVTSDVEVALEAAVGDGPGVVLVAGTGSIACGRNSAGKLVRAGGLGPRIGDEGSAYDIGRRAVAAVARAREQRGPLTLLADLIPEDLECPNWETLLERIAQNPDDVFPRLFPTVALAADAEDDVAREILFTAALALSQMALSVIRRLGLLAEEFLLAKSGGVFGHSSLLDSAVDSLVASAASRARIEPLRVSPAVGAARLARRLIAASEASAGRGKAVHGARG